MLRHFTQIGVAFALALLCLPVRAQTDESGSVTGSAQVVLRPKATSLRFYLVLREESDDMEPALKSLDVRCKAYRKALLAANASKDSIRSEGPTLVGRLQALGKLLRAQQRSGKGKSQQLQQGLAPQYSPPQSSQPGGQPPADSVQRGPRITLTTNVTAEWPLTGRTAPDLLVEADRIVLRVHEATKGFVSKKIPPRPEPQPSQAQTMGRYYKGQTLGPYDEDDEDDEAAWGERPNYLFVGQVFGEQVRKARGEAFEKAKAQAAAVAMIGGSRIGALQGISASFGGRDAYDPFAAAPPSFLGPGMGPPDDVSRADHPDIAEAVAADPSALQYSVGVSAAFRVQQAAVDAGPAHK